MIKSLDNPQKLAVNLECKSYPNYLSNNIRFYKKYDLSPPHISNSMRSSKNSECIFTGFSVFFNSLWSKNKALKKADEIFMNDEILIHLGGRISEQCGFDNS